MSVGRSHVISPRDGAFTLLAWQRVWLPAGGFVPFWDLLQLASGLEKGRDFVSCRGLDPNRVVVYPRVPHVPAAAGLMRGYSSTSYMLTGHKQSKRLSPTK